jgi:hypothetical protein
MRDINSLTRSKMEKAWAVNNSMAHEPHSTQEVTQRRVHILDAINEKVDPQSVVSTNCTRLSVQDQNKLLELLIEYEEFFDGTLGVCKTESISFEPKEGAKPYHVGRSHYQESTKKNNQRNKKTL